MNIEQYIAENKSRFLDELYNFIRIQSISSEKDNPAMLEATQFLKQSLVEAGADNVEVIATAGYPVVYAEKIIDSKLPTVLVYGHYDVQPVDPINEWVSPPLEPQIRDERLYGRGTSDDKGQIQMHLKVFEYMVRYDCQPCNIKFMIEGEEEIGSPNLALFCENNKEKLQCDIILISDTNISGYDKPSITTALRGLCYLEIKVRGPKADLHSGEYGGAVVNPINALSKMIASCFDENNRVTIPGFYDDVLEVQQYERDEINKVPFDLEQYKQALHVEDVAGEAGFNTVERTAIRPCLDVNGIWGGYTGEGSKTIIPAEAHAKISMRLVYNQNPDKIASLVTDYFTTIAPKGIQLEIQVQHTCNPYLSPLDTIAVAAARQALADSFHKPAMIRRSGGSIGIVPVFEKILGSKSILLGFAQSADAAHSPNESFSLPMFYRGIETILLFYKHFIELRKY